MPRKAPPRQTSGKETWFAGGEIDNNNERSKKMGRQRQTERGKDANARIKS